MKDRRNLYCQSPEKSILWVKPFQLYTPQLMLSKCNEILVNDLLIIVYEIYYWL